MSAWVPYGLTESMMSSATRVSRSVGELNSVAVARQWIQGRLEPLATSQKIRRGLFSTRFLWLMSVAIWRNHYAASLCRWNRGPSATLGSHDKHRRTCRP